ncbi:MAG: hypothetical protein ACJ8GW_17050 [Massilia sp.]
MELSKAHVDAGLIRRGEPVWLVSVVNAGASDLVPIPDALVWVRASDGLVVHLAPAR